MNDTIAAICTALSPSGIGIIRISGPSSISIADKIFRTPKGTTLSESPSHTIHYGHIYDKDVIIDEVLVLLMKAPKSYTTEDVVEIDCHGGLYVLNKVLNLCLLNGCRIAEPGEFTKRAFLNGRMDLTEAEAVMDLISAKGELARKNSVSVLNGYIYERIKSIREEVLYIIARIEAALDDPEHMSLEGYEEEIREKITDIRGRISSLINSYENGRLVNEGIKTAIVGKPNVGKSSLLNMLLNENRAIVTQIPGTTRDTLEETVIFGGISLNLIDTAGIHDTFDSVEKIGIQRSEEAIKKADLVIFIVDSSRDVTQEDDHIISLIEGKKVICIMNKCDLPEEISIMEFKSHFENYEEKPIYIKASAYTGQGRDEIIKAIEDMFYEGKIDFNDEVFLSNVRQKNCLCDADSSLLKVLDSIDADMPEDFLSIDLMSAYSSLGEIIGEEVNDDLVDKIFSEFCMGK